MTQGPKSIFGKSYNNEIAKNTYTSQANNKIEETNESINEAPHIEKKISRDPNGNIDIVNVDQNNQGGNLKPKTEMNSYGFS